MTAPVFEARHDSLPPPPLSDGGFAWRLLTRLRARGAPDRLLVCPAVLTRTGLSYRGRALQRPSVILTLDDDNRRILSADAARRLALIVQALGREGAAHDLLGAADLAESLAFTLSYRSH